MHRAPVGMEGHAWMRRMDSTASVLRALSPHTVIPRWMSAAAVLVSMAHAGMTLMGMRCCILFFFFFFKSLTWLYSIKGKLGMTR